MTNVQVYQPARVLFWTSKHGMTRWLFYEQQSFCQNLIGNAALKDWSSVEWGYLSGRRNGFPWLEKLYLVSGHYFCNFKRRAKNEVPEKISYIRQSACFQKNIARIANAVQVPICLLVSTSVYQCLLMSTNLNLNRCHCSVTVVSL